MSASRRLLAALALAVTTGSVSADGCQLNPGIHQYYTEIGCGPVAEDSAGCRTEYDCTETFDVRETDACYLHGNVFESESDVTGIDAAACVGSTCTCERGIIDCPELVACPEYDVELPEGCFDLFTDGVCCPTGKLCVQASKPGAFKCQYAGLEYVVGQHFIQKEKPCQSCTCQEGFDGSMNGPWCKPFTCYYELLASDKLEYGCTPVLHEAQGTCCTREWRCPLGTDTILPSKTNKPSSKSECAFGDLVLRKGDALNQVNPCVKCVCAVPPHVTCIKEENCG